MERAEDDGWRPLWRLEITPGLSCGLTIGSFVLLVVSAMAVIALDLRLHPDSGHGSAPVLPLLVEACAVLVATYALHEGVHALVFMLGGGRPRFGAAVRSGLPVLYVGWPGQRISRDRFVLVALAPLVVLDLAGLALMLPAGTAFGGGLAVVLNTSGAIGDIYMTVLVLGAPRWLHVEDMGFGLLAWAPPAHAAGAGEMALPSGLGVLPSTPDWAAIEAGRRRAAGEHGGRGWHQMAVWWLIISVLALPGGSLLAPVLVPFHPPADTGRQLSTGWPYLLALFGIGAALSASFSAVLVLVVTAGLRLVSRRRPGPGGGAGAGRPPPAP